jgi:hypothetical protein
LIIDTFPFNRDFNALEIRYEELRGTVDLFVASESAFTHSGLPKELHLTNASTIQRLMGRQLQILASTKPLKTNNPRTREMLQREQITRFIRTLDLEPQDIISHSDCDEIPRASILQGLMSREELVDVLLDLDNYANYLNMKDGTWPRGRVQSYANFRGIQKMRADIFIFHSADNRRHGLPFMRLTDFWSSRRYPFYLFPEHISLRPLELINRGGWHFNNLISENEILQKIQSSCHIEWNTPEVRKNAIENYRKGRDIYTGQAHLKVEIDEHFPLCITSNTSRWLPYILK